MSEAFDLVPNAPTPVTDPNSGDMADSAVDTGSVRARVKGGPPTLRGDLAPAHANPNGSRLSDEGPWWAGLEGHAETSSGGQTGITVVAGSGSSQEQDIHRQTAANGHPYRLERPDGPGIPVVVASPHSGREYPETLLLRSALDPTTLRSSEDGFVDELFASAPALGAPFLHALFPRVWVDVNREAYELDPTMFRDRLPDHVITRNARIAAGLGTIARVVANAAPVYAEKLRFAEG